MSYVATLISDPDHPAVTEELAGKVARVLPHAGRANWLAPGVAADIMFGEPANQAGAPAGLLKKLSRELRSIVNQGRSDNGDWLVHQRLGFNFRMDEMSAAVGLAQLEKL